LIADESLFIPFTRQHLELEGFSFCFVVVIVIVDQKAISQSG
jgi:hypothetical protein